ncbi:MAG: isovaleryl-CoA dehydrogenase [Thermoleophilia bacterium]|nr:isovaleryl-CoA dehydrogenase [Thermoleophilia bacterium]
MRPVPNHAPPTADHDSWAADPSSRWWLGHTLRGLGGASADDPQWSDLLGRVGTAVGSVRLRDAADRANRVTPELATWDRSGSRIDDVRFDPSWHELVDEVTASGVCGLPWLDEGAGYVVRGAAMEQWARLDIGVMCPVTMTAAAVPVLLRAESAAHEMGRDILKAARAGLDGAAPSARSYAGRGGAHPLMGMAMTEPQGGSDLSGSTVAAAEQGDGSFRLTGHKWFCSHPTVDGILALAREPGAGEGSRGLSCFFVPGWLPDGSRNAIQLQRLKDKLGTRSLASAEVVFAGAHAQRVGAPGRGVPTIIEMVVHTRMDCCLGSAGILARAVGEAVHHTRGRRAFGRPLVEQPLMRAVLADLLLEREAALALAYEVTRGFQVADPVGRLVTAVAKYWITRRAVTGCIECVEVLGGNGYTEEFPVARLYRDAQVNSTWEGSGNVMALDVLRAMAKDPTLVAGARARVAELVDGAPDDVASAVASFAAAIDVPTGEADARRFAGRLALALQAALLAHRAAATGEEADAIVARAFVATRLEGSSERVFGDADHRLLDAAEPLLARAPIPA